MASDSALLGLPPTGRTNRPMMSQETLCTVHTATSDTHQGSVTGSMPQHRNVVLFGDTGSGKSSIVNMLRGDRQAPVSGGASGVTFKSESYLKQIRSGEEEEYFMIHDTAGINEANTGTVPAADAVRNLWNLLGKLDTLGLHLLVLVVKGPRLTNTGIKNYSLLKAVVGDEVPIAVIVTGLENEIGKQDQWWRNNKTAFEAAKMRFAGHACISATRGRELDLSKKTGERVYDEVYEASILKVETLLLDTAITMKCTRDPRLIIILHLVKICSFFGIQAPGFNTELFELLKTMGIEEKVARKLTNKVAGRGGFRLPLSPIS